jgi:hypothetical protein
LQELAKRVAEFRQLAATLQQPRPDVADAVSNALAAFCTPDRVAGLCDLYAMDAAGQALANGVVDAFGIAIAPAFVAMLEDPVMHARSRALVPLMCEHGRLLAPVLAARLGHCGVPATRAIVRVLGFAGPHYEKALAAQLGRADEQTGREALRALAQIGTAHAAAIVGAQLREGASALRAAAEEALRHFPPAQASAELRDLLAHREFVLQNPQITVRLLDRAAQTGWTGLEPAMRTLVPLRFRFWNPALVRVALKARTLLGQVGQ